MGRRLGVLVDPETNTSYGKDSHSSADEKRDDDASDVDGSEEISDEDDKEDDDVDAENLRSINKETIEVREGGGISNLLLRGLFFIRTILFLSRCFRRV